MPQARKRTKANHTSNHKEVVKVTLVELNETIDLVLDDIDKQYVHLHQLLVLKGLVEAESNRLKKKTRISHIK